MSQPDTPIIPLSTPYVTHPLLPKFKRFHFALFSNTSNISNTLKKIQSFFSFTYSNHRLHTKSCRRHHVFVSNTTAPFINILWHWDKITSQIFNKSTHFKINSFSKVKTTLPSRSATTLFPLCNQTKHVEILWISVRELNVPVIWYVHIKVLFALIP